MIELKNISKIFDDHVALKNINLKIDQKETVVIIGSSGSGKSTLLRLMNYLEMPNRGSVHINGTKINQNNRHKLCAKIGMVFQHYNLFRHMSVLENMIYAPMHVYGESKKESSERAYELLKKFNMHEKIDTLPSNLSGGQRQRVAICRALMMNPEAMLFDEPTSALDPEAIKDIVEIILMLKKEMTMIFITHHIKFAKVIADRVLFMDKGLLLSDQKADNFFKKPDSHRARLFLQNVGDFI